MAMAVRPVHPCTHPGCSRLLVGNKRRCAQHMQVAVPLAQEGNTQDRKRWRAEGLALEPLCRCCRVGYGRTRPSKVADHIVPLTRGGGWEAENRQMLCKQCHNAKSAMERAGYVAMLVPGAGFVRGERYVGPQAPRAALRLNG